MQIQSTLMCCGARIPKKKKPVVAGYFKEATKILLSRIFEKIYVNNHILSKIQNYSQSLSSLNKSIYNGDV